MDNSFWVGVGMAVANWAIPILLGVISMFAAKFFAKNKEDDKYALIALNIVKQILGVKLGPKANAVFDVWTKALTQLKDGNYSDEIALNTFVEFVKLGAKENKVDLTDSEIAAITEAAKVMLDMLSVKSKPTEKAVKAMMVSST